MLFLFLPARFGGPEVEGLKDDGDVEDGEIELD